MYKVLYLIREITFLRCKQAGKQQEGYLPAALLTGDHTQPVASSDGCFASLSPCPWLSLRDRAENLQQPMA